MKYRYTVHSLLVWICFCTVLCLCACNNTIEIPSQKESESNLSSAPFCLSHTVTDLSDCVPIYLTDRNAPAGDGKNGLVSYLNSYMKNGILYLYTKRSDCNEISPRLVPVSDKGIHEDEIRMVPEVNGYIPDFAYGLNENRFCLLYTAERPSQDPMNPIRQPMMAITDAQGNRICEVMFSISDEIEQGDISTTGYYFDIEEEANGDVTVLVSHRSRCVCYRYRSATQTMERVAPTQNGIVACSVRNGVNYLGGQRYFVAGTVGDSDQATILDFTTGTDTAFFLRIPQKYAAMHIAYGENDTWYFYDACAVWRYEENLPPVKILDFLVCDLLFEPEKDSLHIVDDHTVYLVKNESSGFVSQRKLYHIAIGTVQKQDDRNLLKLDYYGSENNYAYEMIRYAVATFNAQNTQYRIQINLHRTTASDADADLSEQLLYHAHPDMIFFDTAEPSRYYEKGLFLDLYGYVSDTLFPCVTEAMLWNGNMYAVPINMSVDTFVSLSETADTMLSWETFSDIADHLSAYEAITSRTTAISRIYRNAVMDFFDLSTGYAAYDTDLFRCVIECVSDLDAKTESSYGYLYGSSFLGYTASVLPTVLQNGVLKFLDVSFSSPYVLQAMHLLFGDQEANFCGYPSNHGGGATVSTHGTITVLSDSDKTEGCLAFVSFLLSDTVQSHHTQRYLSVTESGMRTQLYEIRYSYYRDAVYAQIGDPMALPSYAGTIQTGCDGENVVLLQDIISLTPIITSPTHLNPDDVLGEKLLYDASSGIYKPVTYTERCLSDDDIESFVRFLNNCHMKANADTTVLSIVEEELSYWKNGIGTLEDAAKKIQSRVQIYLNE